MDSSKNFKLKKELLAAIMTVIISQGIMSSVWADVTLPSGGIINTHDINFLREFERKQEM